jgi:hypothetical protein
MMVSQPGFFDADQRLQALSAAGDPLERLRAVVEFELFRPELETAIPRADRSRGGRPPYDAVLMFRVQFASTGSHFTRKMGARIGSRSSERLDPRSRQQKPRA